MNPQLAPIHTPAFISGLTSGNALSSLPLSGIESIAIVVLFVAWCIYTCIFAYHWIVYGGFTHRGVPSLAVHILVSISFFLYAMSGIS